MSDDISSHKPVNNRWMVTLVIVSIAQAMCTGGISLVFPFLPLYIQTLDGADFISPELLAGLVISAPPLMAAITTPFWGRLADQYGRKKMVMRAVLTGAVILFLMGFVKTAFMLIFLRGLQGFTTGIIAANTALVAGECPRERMGFALGTLQVGIFGGVAIGPIFGGILADNYGFQVPFLFTSVMLLLAFLLVTFGVRETYVPPTDAKLDLNPVHMWQAWGQIVTLRGVKTVYSLRFLNGFAQRTIVPIAPLFVFVLLPNAAESGSSSYAGLVMAVSSVTVTIGSMTLGALGDKYGYRIVLLGASLGAMLFYIPQAFVSDIYQLLFLQGLSGFMAGGVMASPAAMLANFTDMGDEGSVYGLDASVSSLSNGLAPLTGAMIASIFGLRAAFIAAAIYYGVMLMVGLNFLPKPKRLDVGLAPRAVGGD